MRREQRPQAPAFQPSTGVREVPRRNRAFSPLNSRAAALHGGRIGGLTAPLRLNYHSSQLERFPIFDQHCSGRAAAAILQILLFK
jgi:hypothetical protein